MVPTPRYVYAIKDEWPIAVEQIARLRSALDRAEARLAVEATQAKDAQPNQCRG